MRSVVLMVLAALACALPARSEPANTPAATRAYLTGLSVADLDRSIAFYQTHFGFVVVERTSFTEFKMELAFLELNGFQIELVELEGSVPRRAPTANDASLQGVAKLGFAVADVDAVVKRLKEAGAPVVVEPFDDERRGFRGAMVRDPDGNLIGLYQLKK